MGSATAYHLARNGKSVLLLEQFEVGHENGSSHGNSRVFRLSYEDTFYVSLARAAKPMWLELEAQSKQKLFYPTGGLDLAEPGSPVFQDCMKAMKAEGIEYEVLNASQIRSRFPQFHINDSMIGIYQDDTAVLNAVECVKVMASLACKSGAVLKENSPVVGLKNRAGVAEISTGAENYRARSVVINAGAWANGILAHLNLQLPLQARKEQYQFFAARDPDIFKPGKMPIFLEYGCGDTDIIGMYGFPLLEMNAVKVAAHQRGPYIDLSERTFELEVDGAADVEQYVRQRFGDALGEVVASKTCLYTNTPDQHFVIDKIPGHENIILSSPCSGHGFKFAIVIGKMAAELATEGRSSRSLSLFEISRLMAAQS
ncbi:MAG: N-methyl-L-tryptophan oxidase [Cyanobacteria bacterium SZAS-4]|nr:N-methyl-L-tryptophan oxidase [Cyanobacteria bacterium SZAS-4]